MTRQFAPFVCAAVSVSFFLAFFEIRQRLSHPTKTAVPLPSSSFSSVVYTLDDSISSFFFETGGIRTGPSFFAGRYFATSDLSSFSHSSNSLTCRASSIPPPLKNDAQSPCVKLRRYSTGLHFSSFSCPVMTLSSCHIGHAFDMHASCRTTHPPPPTTISYSEDD